MQTACQNRHFQVVHLAGPSTYSPLATVPSTAEMKYRKPQRINETHGSSEKNMVQEQEETEPV